MLSKVLLQQNLCFISDQLLARVPSDDHRHALFQVLLCFYFTSVFDGIVWWSDWRRRWWRRPWLGGCHKVCSHIIICCFLWRYRGFQFKHNIGSLLHGSSLCTLQYISFLLPNRQYNSFKRIGRTHYKLSVLLHE